MRFIVRFFAICAWLATLANVGAAYASWQATEYALSVIFTLISVGSFWVATAVTGAIMRGEE